MRPYVIWSPPFDHKIGGIRALYALRDELRARGLPAYMHHEHQNPAAIVVYPEIIAGNPLAAERIVRWRLNKATVIDDGLTFDWQAMPDPQPRLTVDILEHDLFTRRDQARSGVALVVRKGTSDPALIPAGAVEITNEWPTTREVVADLLASVDHVISFDMFCQINVEAMLLGTPVLLYPTGNWTRAEIEAQGWTGNGVAWHPDELDAARRATVGAWDWYRNEVSAYPALVDSLITETQARWP